MQKTVHASPSGTVRKNSRCINPSAGSVRPLRSWCTTGSHLFSRRKVRSFSNRLVVWELPGLPIWKECTCICAVIGEARSFCSELVTESYLVVPAVHVELVLRELRRLLELLLCTDFSCSHLFRTRWWRFIMSTRTYPPATEPAVDSGSPGAITRYIQGI